MTNLQFTLVAILAGAAVVASSFFVTNEYYIFAAYFVAQYVVLAVAWNILGGYVGYVNFGTTAFFAIGLYSAAALNKFADLPIPLLIVVAGLLSGFVGLAVGYLTIRLRGVYFTIATLALSVVTQTVIMNWDYVGGSRGLYIIRPDYVPVFGSYLTYLFFLMILLAVLAVITARIIERSKFGLGLAAVRDEEAAAEATGVPTLRLKLTAASISGALMGMAGAPLPFYLTYIEPTSSFSLAYTVNSVAMPLIGGTASWLGPFIGALLLGTAQQAMTVMISSSLNLLMVGVTLVLFVVLAPNGILGLFKAMKRDKPQEAASTPISANLMPKKRGSA
ncbi:branched-chain amino acid transport system permease protein [Neorhizobium galegae]|uniref:branched-chain amino acid ABC transporter permease n=1 Tax=Neorhizobium galegae TaxID=399 RepID=UPI0027812FA0|nr:branched-chain amino acid ABC transporter permease [Neorhizobium galegae]MDQ0137631.1 branched-chain amino acid transport system permease protein [Neorhizobium galegae]